MITYDAVTNKSQVIIIGTYCNWTCNDMIYAIMVLLDNICVRRQCYIKLFGIPMGANRAPLIAASFIQQ